MATNTTRTALVKPDTTDPVDIAQINSNSDKIDYSLGMILVNDGASTTDINAFDGAIVREKTSGIIWEARKNGGGTFDKVYIRYPYHFEALSLANTNCGSSTTYQDWGWNTFYPANAKNSSAAQLNGTNFWVCPVKGIYVVTAHQAWTSNGTGFRAGALKLNGTLEGDNTEDIQTGNTQAGMKANCSQSFQRLFSVSDIIGLQVWQSSGGNLTVYSHVSIDMIEPVQ